MSSSLLIRADADRRIGTGHVMRCLALAQAWQDAGGNATFVVGTEAPALEKRLVVEGIQVVHLDAGIASPEDADLTARLARERSTEWIVLDGYKFGAEYQQAIKQAGFRLLCIDDYGHARHYCADLVLNQNISADGSLYLNRSPNTEFLLGTTYALLRREFLEWRRGQRDIPSVARKVLVTLGGSDPDDVTLKVIRALKLVETIHARIVVGPANPHAEALRLEIGEAEWRLKILSDVSNMPESMAWADFAISAGGSTCWELAFMGLPSLLLVLADNQRPIAEGMDSFGAAANLGEPEGLTITALTSALASLSTDRECRERMSHKGRLLVDGEGAARAVMRLRGESFRLRRVRPSDVELIWKWANDPTTRASSFSTDSIPWEQHVEWFTSKIESPLCVFYVAVNQREEPIGQVRFDLERCEAMISVSLAPTFRGQWLGSTMIRRASEKLLGMSDVELIRAYVKTENEASVRAFEKAGFKQAGMTTTKGAAVCQFTFSTEDLA